MKNVLQESTAQKWALSFVFKSESDLNISAKKKKKTEQQLKLRTNLELTDISLIRIMLLRHNIFSHSSSVKSRKRGISLGLNSAYSGYSKMDSIIALCILIYVTI